MVKFLSYTNGHPNTETDPSVVVQFTHQVGTDGPNYRKQIVRLYKILSSRM